METSGEGYATLIFFLFMYMLPTVVAWRRGHRNTLAIAALNILTGWTVIGWVVTLVWSLTANTREREPR